jgi:hypothetical protein
MHTKPLSENLKEKSPGSWRNRWQDNIKMDVKKIGYKGVDLIYVAQRRNTDGVL